MDHTAVQPAQRFDPLRFYQWLEKEKAKAQRIAVCYEAGCFGYEPARRMQAMGVEVYVIAPQSWDEQGKRQVNDKWDAAVMCRRLSEYLDGYCKALSIVHIPSPKEEEERAAARFREQLCKGTAPDWSQGARPLIAKRNGGARPMVAREQLAENHSRDALVGGAPTGNLERVDREAGKTHQPSGETTAMQCSGRAGTLWRG
jgi:transposase